MMTPQSRTSSSNDRRLKSAAALATFWTLSGMPSTHGFSTSYGSAVSQSLSHPLNRGPLKHADFRRKQQESSLYALPNKPLSSSSPLQQQTSSSTALDSSVAMPISSSVASLSDTQQEDFQWSKQNMAIALPALMGLLADPVLSMIDTGFVGRVGPIDLAALGVCTSIFNMAFTVFRASTVATTSLVGSAKTKEDKRQIAKISLQLGGILGTIVLLTLRLGGPAILATMGVASDSPMFKPACDYLFARSWAAPAVVGVVIAEGAFRGNDDSKTPLVASSIAALINLVLDPLLMFPFGMGMTGAAIATAISQFGAAGVFTWRMWKRKLLPQPNDKVTVKAKEIVKTILGANLAMLTKQGSMLVFYTIATALATRMGPAHVATHQVALSLFWLVTYWLDSGSVSAQVLMGKNNDDTQRATSLTKYMAKYAVVQGVAFSALVAGIGKFVPGVFTADATIQSLLFQCLPYLALQQTIVSITLILEGLAVGGNQFRYMATGTAAATFFGIKSLLKATSVVDIWSTAVNTFFGLRLLNAIIGVARVHIGLRRRDQSQVTAIKTA